MLGASYASMLDHRIDDGAYTRLSVAVEGWLSHQSDARAVVALSSLFLSFLFFSLENLVIIPFYFSLFLFSIFLGDVTGFRCARNRLCSCGMMLIEKRFARCAHRN